MDFSGFMPGFIGLGLDLINVGNSGARAVAGALTENFATATEHFMNFIFNGIGLVLPLIGNHVKGYLKQCSKLQVL